jgi:glycosyltransferase involved in cell wall biosynthesis
VRVLTFHGYLLRGTGSNVYNAKLAEALRRAGHEVHLLCQDPAPQEFPWVDAVGTWRDGRLEVEVVREPVRATVYRPPIGRLLPVYVADRYEGFDAKPFPDCTDEELAEYLERNVAAVREVAQRVQPDAALANHLVMGPVVLARAGVPCAVKVHGSALEYVVKPHRERFLPYAQEGLANARAVLVGSRHTGESLWGTVGDDVRARTRLGPPGVDIEQFSPRTPGEAADGLHALAQRLAAEAPAAAAAAGDAFALDHAAAGRALARLDPHRDRIVTFTGKLIVSKGVDLLVAAWPLVLARDPEARLAVVGFGAYREGLEALQAALAAGDADRVVEIAEAGWELEGGPRAPLRHLLAFLRSPAASGEAYRRAAALMPDRVAWCGRLEHDELAELLPACQAQVVPSTFPEAFGMVAAEAAAAGVLPVSAGHSGLAEVSRTLAAAVPDEAAPLLSFPVGDGAVEAIAERLIAWLAAPEELRARTRAALVATARERFSWEGVASGVLAASAGRVDELPEPA